MPQAAPQLDPLLLEQIPEWSQFANYLADAARTITLRYFRKEVATKMKADASPVTQADRETEETLRRMINARYPDHGISGEEYGVERPNARVRWVIDPIDGTRAFIAGVPTFVTLIALLVDNYPVLGIIDQPCKQERWEGAVDRVTTLNNLPLPSCRVNSPSYLNECMLGTTGESLFAPNIIDRFRTLQAACGSFHEGGDGYLYGRLSCGEPQIVCEAGLKTHDFCALIPVVHGAGGIITDWNGDAVHYGSNGNVLAATSPELHAQALAYLNA